MHLPMREISEGGQASLVVKEKVQLNGSFAGTEFRLVIQGKREGDYAGIQQEDLPFNPLQSRLGELCLPAQIFCKSVIKLLKNLIAAVLVYIGHCRLGRSMTASQMNYVPGDTP